MRQDIRMIHWVAVKFSVGNDMHEMRRRARDRAVVDATANINRDLRRWREALKRKQTEST